MQLADCNRDGKVDFYVSSFSDDYNSLYRNKGAGNFSKSLIVPGWVMPTIPFSLVGKAPLVST